MLRSLVGRHLPPGMRRAIVSRLERSRLFMRATELAQWRTTVDGLTAYHPSDFPERVLLMSCDPWTLMGSRGDEAMTRAVIERVRAVNPAAQVGIVTASAQGSAAAISLDAVPFQCWKRPFSYRDIVSTLDDFRPDAVLVVGADVLDGHYSPAFSARMLLSADIAARVGARTAILGFSFNSPNAQSMKPVLDALSDKLAVNIRDEVSLGRFVAFTGRAAALTADMAFLLAPTRGAPALADVIAWIGRMRAAGKVVVGLNVHPLLFRGLKSRSSEVVSAFKEEVEGAVHDKNIALLLISHDVRPEVGDQVLLKPLAAALASDAVEDFGMAPAGLTAAEVKELAGHLDCILAARMHLAIAALGMGTPVAAITYQGKFEGLFRQFGLDPSHMVSPREALEPGRLRAAISDLVHNRQYLGARVREALPSVLNKAELNLSVLKGISHG